MEPLVDIMDVGSEYRIVLDLPGVHDAGVEVHAGLAPGTLSITAKPSPVPSTEGWPVLRERSARNREQPIQRLLPVAWDADVEKAKSRIDAGVLTIVVPKKQQDEAGHKGQNPKAKG